MVAARGTPPLFVGYAFQTAWHGISRMPYEGQASQDFLSIIKCAWSNSRCKPTNQMLPALSMFIQM